MEHCDDPLYGKARLADSLAHLPRPDFAGGRDCQRARADVARRPRRDGPELALVTDSCDYASARIRFFRIAFGAATDNALVARSEVMAVLQALGEAGRVSYDWAPGGDLPRREVQLALLALQCVETALPRGGEICLEYQPGHWSVTGLSERIHSDPAQWQQLERIAQAAAPESIEPQVAPNHVQFVLLPLLARELGRRPGVEEVKGG